LPVETARDREVGRTTAATIERAREVRGMDFVQHGEETYSLLRRRPLAASAPSRSAERRSHAAADISS